MSPGQPPVKAPERPLPLAPPNFEKPGYAPDKRTAYSINVFSPIFNIDNSVEIILQYAWLF